MSAKGTSRPKMVGYRENSGQVGFVPWDDGQYLVEVVEASDDKPTSNGDYMLKLKTTILDGIEQEDGRDPLGRQVTFTFPLPDPEASWYDFALTRLKNAIMAFGVRVQGDEVPAPSKFVGKRAAVELVAKLDKKTGQVRQDNNGFLPVEASEYADQA